MCTARRYVPFFSHVTPTTRRAQVLSDIRDGSMHMPGRNLCEPRVEAATLCIRTHECLLACNTSTSLACCATHVVCHHTAHVIWSCWFEKVVRVCNRDVLVTRLYVSVLLWLQFHEIGLVFEYMYTVIGSTNKLVHMHRG